MAESDPRRRTSLELEELAAFATVAWKLVKRRGISTETVSFVTGLARQELEAAGGVAGLRELIADRVGGPAPRPRTAVAPTRSSVPPPRSRLRGTGLCPGRAEGPARRLLGPSAAGRPQTGAVLVCARLDLTTAMELDRRAAVVVETGSSAAAPLRAAQSRGIPVVRLRDAISLISEGTIVAVDGTLGQVEIAA